MRIKLPPKGAAYPICGEQDLDHSTLLAVLQDFEEESQKLPYPLLIIPSIFAQLDPIKNDEKTSRDEGEEVFHHEKRIRKRPNAFVKQIESIRAKIYACGEFFLARARSAE
ncbi:MAG: hypothetical protein ALECFALPRED_009089 [Alectoria fallacina]|uniref:Uncharacterized protein n=1 Tax=Alectoria fallacina TaxID=1903189 RepID=A0A8H3J6H4_9LECA|nr:MAG: hypothetical protein ALECFALPRED_009089 [Alectoria fallacina]